MMQSIYKSVWLLIKMAKLLVRQLSLIFIFLSVGFCRGSYATVPVVDAYQEQEEASTMRSAPSKEGLSSSNLPVSPSNNATSFSLEQRVTILERQIANLNPILVQVDDLQQQLQDLRGKLEVQQHTLQSLVEQQRNQYLDIEKRLNQRFSFNRANKGITDKVERSKLIGAKSASGLSTYPSMSPSLSTPLSKSKEDTVSKIGRNSTSTAASERAYQSAFQLLKNKQYDEAIESLEDFSRKYPNDLNMSNVDYFLGQLYLLQGKPVRSISYFRHFISRCPEDPRIPDALLQLGLAYFTKGDKEEAMSIFDKIVQQYPDSTAAESAKARLQQFKALMSASTITPVKKVA